MSATGMSNGMREEIAQIYSEQAMTLIAGQGCAAVEKGVDYWNGCLVYDTLVRQSPAKSRDT